MRRVSAHTPRFGPPRSHPRASCPTAADHLDKLRGARVAVVVLGMRIEPEVERRVAVVRGDDVPSDAATGDVIGGRQASGELVGRVIGRCCRTEQSDPAAVHPEGGQQRDRVVPHLRKEARAKRGERWLVGDEHRVEQSALGERRRTEEAVDRCRLDRVVLLNAPTRLVIAIGRQDDREVGVTLRGHDVAPFGSTASSANITNPIKKVLFAPPLHILRPERPLP
jgi:hypothetical protein